MNKSKNIVAKKKRFTLRELKSCFVWGMKENCPYIWLGWWLITFDPFNISFMPD